MPENEIAEKACNYIKGRIEQVKVEHKQIIDKLEIDQDVSGEQYAKQIKEDLEVSAIQLETYHNTADTDILSKSFKPIYYNPMPWVHDYSLKILGDSENIVCQITEGKWLPYGYASNTIPTLGEKNYWSTTYSSAFSNTLLHMDPTFPEHAAKYAQKSAFFHATPLLVDDKVHLKGYRYSYAPNVYGYVHNGYTYDGSRHDQKLFPKGKRYNALDCSQFVGEILDMPKLFRTEDMLFCRRHLQGKGYVRKGWLQTQRAQMLCKSLEVVDINDVRPGDVHVLTDFRNKKKATSKRVHYHGHTTIVFSQGQKSVNTLGNGQYPIPQRDGLGFEEYSMAPTEILENGDTREPFFLRLKS